MGRPTHDMVNAFQRAVKQIKKVEDWPAFFEWIGLPPPRDAFLSKWLTAAVHNSVRRHYHNPRLIKDARSKLKDKDRMDDREDPEENGAKPKKGRGKGKGKKGKEIKLSDDDDIELGDYSNTSRSSNRW